MNVQKQVSTSDFKEFTDVMEKLRKSKPLKELHFSGSVSKEPKSGDFIENYHVSWSDDEEIK